MKESDIMHENGDFWVGRERSAYTVYRPGITHSTSDSSYERTPDGLSIAVARCDYLAKLTEATRKDYLAARKDYLAGRSGSSTPSSLFAQSRR